MKKLFLAITFLSAFSINQALSQEYNEALVGLTPAASEKLMKNLTYQTLKGLREADFDGDGRAKLEIFNANTGNRVAYYYINNKGDSWHREFPKAITVDVLESNVTKKILVNKETGDLSLSIYIYRGITDTNDYLVPLSLDLLNGKVVDDTRSSRSYPYKYQLK